MFAFASGTGLIFPENALTNYEAPCASIDVDETLQNTNN